MTKEPAATKVPQPKGASAKNVAAVLLLIGLVLFIGNAGGLGIFFIVGGVICIIVGVIQKGSTP